LNMTASNSAPFLNIEKLDITYNAGEWNERKVLDGVSLELEEGDFLVLTGPNGSGKSTLLKALSGDLRDAHIEGSARLNGCNVLTLPAMNRAQLLSVIDQDPGMGTCEHLLVKEQLQLAGKEVSDRVIARLNESGSNIGLDQRIQSLSGGQRQLLTALIAIERQPKLLLADEPTAALDKHFTPRILELLLERAGKPGLVTIVVTHHDTIKKQSGIRRAHIEEGCLKEVQSNQASPTQTE
jgi:putative ABC transport system ATP-binding protein